MIEVEAESMREKTWVIVEEVGSGPVTSNLANGPTSTAGHTGQASGRGHSALCRLPQERLPQRGGHTGDVGYVRILNMGGLVLPQEGGAVVLPVKAGQGEGHPVGLVDGVRELRSKVLHDMGRDGIVTDVFAEPPGTGSVCRNRAERGA